MKKTLSLLLLSLMLSSAVSAQDPLRDKLNNIFANINKSQIPTGFLEEYATPLLPLDVFSGALTDSNRVDLDGWRMVYTTLYSSRIYGTNPMSALSTVNTSLASAESSNTAIPVAMLCADYNTIRNDAIQANLLRISNNQLFDVAGRTQSPYLAKRLFSAAPLRKTSTSGSISLVFKSELFYKLSSKTLNTIHVDFSDGRGYLRAYWNTPINATYSTIGNKRLKIKITFTDASKMECFVDFNVLSVQSARFANPADLIQAFTATGNHAGGQASIRFSRRGTERRITKPLIVVEGFDASGIAPDLARNYGFGDFLIDIDATFPNYNFNFQLDDTAGYDLIFLDYNNGSDDIIRNANLLQEVITWVNQQKAAAGSAEENVVMGLSMGGLVARYALANMTKQNMNPQTRLLITHDSPHRGANTPLGFQFLTRIFGDLKILASVSPSQQIFARDIWKRIGQAEKILDEPASKQMLIIRAKNSFGGTESNTFLDNAYRNMIIFGPADRQPAYRIIATSQGSECGNQIFTPGSELASFNGSVFFGLLHIARRTLKCQMNINALPAYGQSRRITRIKIWHDYRILGSINVNVPIIDYSINSPSNLLPWDGAPGGTSNVRDQAPELPNISWLWVYFELVVNPSLGGDFCFVPAVSALDVVNLTPSALSESYSGGVSPTNTARVANFIAQENFTGQAGAMSNEAHIRFTPRNARWLFTEMENPQGNRLNCSAACPIDFGNTLVLGPSTVCLTNTTYSVPGTTGSVNWTVDPNLITPVSGQGTNTFVVKQRSASGWGFVRAAFTDQCSSAQTVQNTVWVGSYNSSDYPVTGPTSLCEFTDGYYNTNALPAATGYMWFWPSNWTYVNGQGTRFLTVRAPSSGSYSGSVGVRVANGCGPGGSPSTINTLISRCGYYYVSMSPNPAAEELTVEIIDEESSTSPATKKAKIDDITIMDEDGNSLKEVNVGLRKAVIDVRNLPRGTYYVRVSIEKEVSTTRILLE